MKQFFMTFALLFILATPGFCQDQLAGKIVFAGAGIDSSSVPNALGFGGYATPIGPNTLAVAEWESSVTNILGALKGQGVKFTFKGDVAQRVPLFKAGSPFSLWGMLGVGPSFGPAVGTVTIKTAMSYGGFIDVALTPKFGVAVFGQNQTDAASGGFRPTVKVALRWRF